VLAVKSGSPGLLIEREYLSETGRIFHPEHLSGRSVPL